MVDKEYIVEGDVEYPIGKCNCLTKTPAPKYHEHTCPVWMYWRIKTLEHKIGNTRKTKLS
jgi:hypothetical protein